MYKKWVSVFDYVTSVCTVLGFIGVALLYRKALLGFYRSGEEVSEDTNLGGENKIYFTVLNLFRT
jgi:hypothetical protein